MYRLSFNLKLYNFNGANGQILNPDGAPLPLSAQVPQGGIILKSRIDVNNQHKRGGNQYSIYGQKFTARIKTDRHTDFAPKKYILNNIVFKKTNKKSITSPGCPSLSFALPKSNNYYSSRMNIFRAFCDKPVSQ